MKSNKKIKVINNYGMSLLELVVSVGLFSFVIVSVSGIFQMATSSQRESFASQETHENLRYSLEKISKDIRMARKDKLNSCIPTGEIYWINNEANALQFLNYNGQCVCYYVDNESFMTSTGGCDNSTQSSHTPLFIFPRNVKTDNLFFSIIDRNGARRQAIVTLKLHASAAINGLSDKEVEVQTSISSRYYE